jgi:hypothetical protein
MKWVSSALVEENNCSSQVSAGGMRHHRRQILGSHQPPGRTTRYHYGENDPVNEVMTGERLDPKR